MPSRNPPPVLNIQSLSKMKKAAASFLKQIGAVLAAVLKAKSLQAAVRNKTRLIILGLLPSKKVNLVSKRMLHALKGHGNAAAAGEEEVVLSRELMELSLGFVDDDDVYPDLTHCLFNEEEEEEDGSACSAIDLVRSSREGSGPEFKLEDEIDQVAEVFIRKFRRQMRFAEAVVLIN
ncbi:hypothetical protein Cni_G27500 [Canna indica]|uniref:Uncharacterized protein n=1 Tax=Canna indica TaxID=4628 RepID=A0AAQ3QRF4_9LILI|nr:hypothetical protein Cni_G27500 [Canna indica]